MLRIFRFFYFSEFCLKLKKLNFLLYFFFATFWRFLPPGSSSFMRIRIQEVFHTADPHPRHGNLNADLFYHLWKPSTMCHRVERWPLWYERLWEAKLSVASGSPRSRSRPNWVGSGSRQKRRFHAAPAAYTQICLIKLLKSQVLLQFFVVTFKIALKSCFMFDTRTRLFFFDCLKFATRAA